MTVLSEGLVWVWTLATGSQRHGCIRTEAEVSVLVVSIVFVTMRLGEAQSVFTLQVMSDHLKFLLYFPGAMIFKILFIKAVSKNQYIFKQQI